MTDAAVEDSRPRKLSPELRRALAAVKAGTASETEWQRVVIGYAKDRGWLVHHSRKAQVKEGRWVTPVWGHPGWPDLALARDDRLLLLELKTKSGAVSPEQARWHWHLERMAAASGGTVHFGVYRPADLATVFRLLHPAPNRSKVQA